MAKAKGKIKLIYIVIAVLVVVGIVILAVRPAELLAPPQAGALTEGGPEIIRMGQGFSDKHGSYQAFLKFEEIVERETGGRIDVQTFHSGQLGDDAAMIAGLQAGTQEVTFPSTGAVSRFIPGMFVFDLPFIMPPDFALIDSILGGPIGEDLLARLPEHGMVGLGFGENGFRFITNSKREIKSVADLSGLRLRTMENEIHLALFRQLGAMPAPLPFSEVFSALQTGVFDGQENAASAIFLNRFHEVQGFLTDTGHVYAPLVMLMSKIYWDKSTPAEQELFKRATREALAHQRTVTRADNEKLLTDIEAAGVKVTRLTPEARKAFVDATRQIHGQFRDRIGGELLDKVLRQVGL
ncbi:MAG TPA: DctP family TRAP transporter solute-binding subunit [Magnetospirillaceae bacterium]|nr:DctP family TRAP transporter solute-binding subunit [Magnetospirillaceae bacterium]